LPKTGVSGEHMSTILGADRRTIAISTLFFPCYCWRCCTTATSTSFTPDKIKVREIGGSVSIVRIPRTVAALMLLTLPPLTNRQHTIVLYCSLFSFLPFNRVKRERLLQSVFIERIVVMRWSESVFVTRSLARLGCRREKLRSCP
jgi:hypothetical protein